MLRLEMLPAKVGDCLLLEWGDADAAEHRMLIDAGKKGAYRDIKQRLMEVAPDAEGRRRFELLVVTHIDSDHIDGVIALLQDPEINCWFNDIWFNGWRHIEKADPDAASPEVVTLGPKQGEFLDGLITILGQPWNRHFGGRAVMAPKGHRPPVVDLSGGMRLTLLTPGVQELVDLKDDWSDVITDSGYQPGMGVEALAAYADSMLRGDGLVTLGDEADEKTLENTAANCSSIAFLAEFGGRRLLLSGDAHAKLLREGLDAWRALGSPVPERAKLDAFKLPHHGSIKNMSPQLMGAIECPVYLVSTNGGGGYHHPDAETVVMIKNDHTGDTPVICFNYRNSSTEDFSDFRGIESRYEEDAVCRWST